MGETAPLEGMDGWKAARIRSIQQSENVSKFAPSVLVLRSFQCANKPIKFVFYWDQLGWFFYMFYWESTIFRLV